MTLTRFVTKNAFRNKRRSTLTVLSIAFSLLLLTLMMTIWRAFYLDQGSAESAERLVVRHRVSLTFNFPVTTGRKFERFPECVAVVPVSWFGGIYKDQKPENFFAQFGTDPDEFFKIFRDIATARGPDHGLAARPPGRDRRRYSGHEIWLEAGRPHRAAGDNLSRQS